MALNIRGIRDIRYRMIGFRTRIPSMHRPLAVFSVLIAVVTSPA